jgi:hypothetical protein
MDFHHAHTHATHTHVEHTYTHSLTHAHTDGDLQRHMTKARRKHMPLRDVVGYLLHLLVLLHIRCVPKKQYSTVCVEI